VPRILLGIAIWDPFVFIEKSNPSNMVGLVPEFIEIMQNTCDEIDVQWVETDWGKCFEDPAAGEEIIYGAVHGCAGYTHLPGLRSRIFEFSHAITVPTANAAGIISRLNADGTPVVSPTSDLSGVKVVDVTGYAPTADLLALVVNECSNNAPMKDYILVDPGANGNAAAMAALRDGRADAMWVYSDQAYNCMKVCGTGGTNAPCPTTDDCYGWHGLGTDYAYIHTGVQYALNGTTMAISKKDSKVGELLNPCIAKALETKEYYDMCKKHHKENECFPNSHFTAADTALDRSVWDSPHTIRPLATGGATCSGGYCLCSELPSESSDTGYGYGFGGA
jgi:hypothetical protein